MKNYDAAIIGGGPIGGFAAEKIASKGFKVAIFEKNNKIGEPVKCAGLVSSRVLKLCNITKENIIQNKIKGANIHSPIDNILRIGGDKVNAIVINRNAFDKEIINNAEKKGAELNLKNEFIDGKKIDDHIKFTTSTSEKYKCNLLIGADGPNSRVRTVFSFQKPTEFLKGVVADIDGIKMDPDFVEIFLGNKIAPGFFAWIIPTDNEGKKARIGLCIKEQSEASLNHYFNHFLKHEFTYKFFKDIKISNKIGGIIPFGPIKNLHKPNVMIVGDAAAQVKPTSGGGISPGLTCANYCSEVAINAISDNNFDEYNLSKYNKFCKRIVLKELDKGMIFRKIFLKLDDMQIDLYIKKFQDKNILDIISKYGDIDYPSKLIPKLIRKQPSLLKLLSNLI
jgi:geranylgeranyl reductase family protein